MDPTPRYLPSALPLSALTVRQAAVLFSKAPERLTHDDQRHLACIFERDEALRPIYQSVQHFGQMVRTLGGQELEKWLEQAEALACPPLLSFATRVRQDLAAVKQGLTQRYSQGPVEGHVHRVKLIKRSGYGRMGFPLLKQRVLASQTS